jgi:TRAP-type C4-dicarboxylate transport system permease small subunit
MTDDVGGAPGGAPGGTAVTGAKDPAAPAEASRGATMPREEARPAPDPADALRDAAPHVEGSTKSAAPQEGARWADPVARFEKRWTWFESRLITFVLLGQLLALVSWVFLNGISESVSQSAGVVFRSVFGGTAFGLAAWLGGRKLPLGQRRALTLAALAVGLALAPLARSLVLQVVAFEQAPKGAGAPRPPSGLALQVAALDRAFIEYFDNIKGWLQGGSTLTLMGGLRGLGTRLTLWLALLGGSLATAAGKHIHIDVIFRFLPKRFRVPAALVNFAAAAMVCFAGAWGFFDHIAIEYYGSNADDPRGQKIAHALHEVSDHLFFTRKQIGLDLRSLPHVLEGERYDGWMSAADWNHWVDTSGFEERFGREAVQTIRVPDDAPPHAPLVLSPTGETTPGMLAHTLGLVFPFGLLAIGLRFLLRAILTLSGHLSADPDEAHKEEIRGAAAGPLDDEGRPPTDARGGV